MLLKYKYTLEHKSIIWGIQYPFYIGTIKSMINYWNFIEYKSDNILLKDAYQYNKETITSNQSNWLEFAYKIVN